MSRTDQLDRSQTADSRAPAPAACVQLHLRGALSAHRDRHWSRARFTSGGSYTGQGSQRPSSRIIFSLSRFEATTDSTLETAS